MILNFTSNSSNSSVEDRLPIRSVKNSNVQKRSQTVDFDFSSLFLLSNKLFFFVMNTQEFILIPESFHTQRNNSTIQICSFWTSSRNSMHFYQTRYFSSEQVVTNNRPKHHAHYFQFTSRQSTN